MVLLLLGSVLFLSLANHDERVPRCRAMLTVVFVSLQEYSEAHRTLSRRGKGEIERENPVVVTAIRSNNYGSSALAPPADSRVSNK